MTYLGAAGTADDAARLAKRAKNSSETESDALLASAVEKLAEAVAELGRALHRAD